MNSLTLEQNKATITGGDPYIGYEGNYKNVCGLKVEILPNLMDQYFFGWQGRDLNENDSRRTNANEISLPTMDYQKFRYDFRYDFVGQTVTINGLYYKCCLDSKKIIYGNNGNIVEEFYAKDIKIKEENKEVNSQLSNIIIEEIAPNI